MAFVLNIVGAAVGFMIGGPFGAQVGALIGGSLANLIDPPKIKGPRLTDLSVSSSTVGVAIPKVYGGARISGNMIWSSGLKEKKKKKSAKGKGKGPKVTTYTYSADFAMAFCVGEIDSIGKVWADGKLISGNPKFTYRIYTGSEDQLPDAIMMLKEGAANCPAFRGIAYIMFDNLPLADFGNRIPSITAEIFRTVDGQQGNENPIYDYSPGIGVFGDVPNGFSAYPTFQAPGLILGGDTSFTSHFTPVNNNGVKFFVNTVFGKWLALLDNEMMTTSSAYQDTPPIIDGEPVSEPHDSWLPGFCTHAYWTCAGNGKVIIPFNPPADPDAPDGGFPDGGYAIMYVSIFGTVEFERFTWPHLGVARRPNIAEMVYDPATDAVIIWNKDPTYYKQVFKMKVNTQQILWSKDLPGPFPTSPLGDPNALPNYPPRAGNVLTGNTHAWTNVFGVLYLMDTDNGNILFKRFAEPIDSFNGKWTAPGFGGNLYDAASQTLILQSDAGTYNSTFNDPSMEGHMFSRAKFTNTGGVWSVAFARAPYSGLTRPPIGNNIAVDWEGKSVFVQSGKTLVQYNYETMTEVMRKNYLAPPTKMLWDDRTKRLIFQRALAYPGIQPGENPFLNTDYIIDDRTEANFHATVYMDRLDESFGTNLAAIVKSVLEDTGNLNGEDITVGDLSTQYVYGYVVSRECTARDVVEQLSIAYKFDVFEADDKLVARFRNNKASDAADHTVPAKRLSYIADRDKVISETKVQELELPMRITVNYWDIDRDFQQGSMSAKRIQSPFRTMNVNREDKLELPIVMTATDAIQIADTSLRSMWAERNTIQLKLPWEYLLADPSDRIDFTTPRGYSDRIRVTEITVGEDLTLSLGAVTYNSTVYTSTVEAPPSVYVPQEPIPTPQAPLLFIINTPLIRDKDDTQGTASICYFAAGAPEGVWTGGFLMGSANAVDYDVLDQFTLFATTGTVTSGKLPATHSWGSMDIYTELTITLDDPDEQLESITNDELLRGLNAAWIGGEIIQFKTATLVGENMYKISNIVRARRGTNYAVNSHVLNEGFVLLEEEGMLADDRGPEAYNIEYSFKAVAPDMSPEDVDGQTVDLEPRDLMPYTPEQVRVEDDGTTATVSFARRSRITAGLSDGTGDIPYREGQTTQAKIKYDLFYDSLLTDPVDWTTIAAPGGVTGYCQIFDPATNLEQETSFTFPVSAMEIGEKAVVVLREIGFVPGFAKVVQIERFAEGEWNLVELY